MERWNDRKYFFSYIGLTPWNPDHSMAIVRSLLRPFGICTRHDFKSLTSWEVFSANTCHGGGENTHAVDAELIAAAKCQRAMVISFSIAVYSHCPHDMH